MANSEQEKNSTVKTWRKLISQLCIWLVILNWNFLVCTLMTKLEGNNGAKYEISHIPEHSVKFGMGVCSEIILILF